jgi:hypothetical protein
MRKPPNNFRNISSEIAYITAQREALVVGAFDALEFRYPALAQVLLESFGSRQRASHWICGPQRALDGRPVCELLADGDEDAVWDLLPDSTAIDPSMRPAKPRLAG